MLIIGSLEVWCDLPEAGASFLLTPLDADVRLRVVSQLASIEDLETRNLEYQRLAGREVLRDWKGVVGRTSDGSVGPMPFTPENVDALMRTVAADFILARAAGLGLRFAESIEQAGNVLRGGPAGTAAEDQKS
ncbi:MAG: hypothetical protein ACLGI7_09315 [Gammaproteobacteria bacterium]